MRAGGEAIQEILSCCMEVRLFTKALRSLIGLRILVYVFLLRLSHISPLCLPDSLTMSLTQYQPELAPPTQIFHSAVWKPQPRQSDGQQGGLCGTASLMCMGTAGNVGTAEDLPCCRLNAPQTRTPPPTAAKQPSG